MLSVPHMMAANEETLESFSSISTHRDETFLKPDYKCLSASHELEDVSSLASPYAADESSPYGLSPPTSARPSDVEEDTPKSSESTKCDSEMDAETSFKQSNYGADSSVNFPTAGAVKEGRKKFTCDICRKKFTEKCSLVVHVKTVHLGERNFCCDLCWKTFTQRSSLATHVKTVHKGQRNFACNVCGRKFGLKQHLSNHVKSVHGGETLICRIGEKKFKYKRSLAQHVKSVHEGGKKCCPMCGK